MEYVNQLWLEDLAVRLVCVLALDRFGDFVSDEVCINRWGIINPRLLLNKNTMHHTWYVILETLS